MPIATAIARLTMVQLLAPRSICSQLTLLTLRLPPEWVKRSTMVWVNMTNGSREKDRPASPDFTF
jgi:hypothetical protein